MCRALARPPTLRKTNTMGSARPGRGNLAPSASGRGTATLGNMDNPPAVSALGRWRAMAVVASVIWACYVLIGGEVLSLLVIPAGWLAIYSIVVIDRWVERGTRRN
jgi:hypothetical protein